MKTSVVAVLVVALGLGACGEQSDSSESEVLVEVEQAVFDCGDAEQRLTCDPPNSPNRKFMCHATTSPSDPYRKINIPIGSTLHTPGVAHKPNRPADQLPGASGADVGSGPGLDCECNERVCVDVCTGAEDGAECDDNDACTVDGTCSGGTCEPGAPRCDAGTVIDACNVETGVCDPETGSCGTTPLPEGTSCGAGQQCDAAGVCTPVVVVVNEVESSGGVPGDWAELYNAGTTTASVGGWVFKDADDTHAYALPAGTTIPPGAYLVLDEAQFGFGLGTADSARLFDGAGAIVDSYAWTAHAVTTYARCPDGFGAFRTATTSSKGATNDCSVHVNVNEVESSGGTPGDWVELYNAGPIAADVGGYRFLDADDTHVPYVIPAGTVIASGGTLVLDEAQFGFGLGSADSARLFSGDGTIVDAYAWAAHAVTTYGRCPNGTGDFRATSSSTKNAANDCSIGVAINEIESSGGVPGDWVQLHNTGLIPFDISGWVFKDSDDTHAYALPPGTTLAPGGYLSLEEAGFGFGLGSADSARLYDAGGTLVDSYAWTAHAATTYGRCPNGTGAFAATTTVTKNAANDCGGTPPVGAWPGPNAVATVDAANTYGTNMSGLFHDGTSLWAVQNGPSMLYQVGGPQWTLRYPGGTGVPDAEDLTIVGGFVYVATERDNDANTVSRPSILRYDPSASGELIATHEWNLLADLPVVGANAGLEAITWIPDSFLVANGFIDQTTSAAYNPASYPDHGGGLFFVGLEANGMIYAYALDHVGGGFVRVASFASGDVTSKALSFDAESGYLWQHCGAACGGQTRVLVPGAGTFVTKRVFDRPSTMANLQNEGIAITACSGGSKGYYWSDDGQTDGHALRVDAIPCGAFIP